MTEDEWQACRDPLRLLNYSCEKMSERKIRLFATACCRTIWDLLLDINSTKLVEVTEKYADGVVELVDLLDARNRADVAVADVSSAADAPLEASRLEARSDLPSFFTARYLAGSNASIISAREYADREAESKEVAGVPDAWTNHWHKDYKQQQENHSDLIRDIFGNPFRAPTAELTWLAWNDRFIPKLAQVIYDERQLPSGHFDAGRLRILAEALEEAGCTNADILSHCRQPGTHVRGCWVIDLLLGKN